MLTYLLKTPGLVVAMKQTPVVSVHVMNCVKSDDLKRKESEVGSANASGTADTDTTKKKKKQFDLKYNSPLMTGTSVLNKNCYLSLS